MAPGSWPCEQTLLGAGAGKAPPCPGAHLPGTRACRVPCARPPAAAHPAGDAASALARQAPPLPYPVRLLVLSISGTEWGWRLIFTEFVFTLGFTDTH